jgi:hypothetical protein
MCIHITPGARDSVVHGLIFVCPCVPSRLNREPDRLRLAILNFAGAPSYHQPFYTSTVTPTCRLSGAPRRNHPRDSITLRRVQHPSMLRRPLNRRKGQQRPDHTSTTPNPRTKETASSPKNVSMIPSSSFSSSSRCVPTCDMSRGLSEVGASSCSASQRSLLSSCARTSATADPVADSVYPAAKLAPT